MRRAHGLVCRICSSGLGTLDAMPSQIMMYSSASLLLVDVGVLLLGDVRRGPSSDHDVFASCTSAGEADGLQQLILVVVLDQVVCDGHQLRRCVQQLRLVIGAWSVIRGLTSPASAGWAHSLVDFSVRLCRGDLVSCADPRACPANAPTCPMATYTGEGLISVHEFLPPSQIRPSQPKI